MPDLQCLPFFIQIGILIINLVDAGFRMGQQGFGYFGLDTKGTEFGSSGSPQVVKNPWLQCFAFGLRGLWSSTRRGVSSP